eukprot:jgi/Tetstr1/439340/TSEL_027778.t1
METEHMAMGPGSASRDSRHAAGELSSRHRLEAFVGSDELGHRALDLLSISLTAQTLKSYAGKLSPFAEICHDSENISPLEATTATVVRQRRMKAASL